MCDHPIRGRQRVAQRDEGSVDQGPTLTATYRQRVWTSAYCACLFWLEQAKEDGGLIVGRDRPSRRLERGQALTPKR